MLACLAGSSLASLPAQVNNADHPPQLVVAPCGCRVEMQVQMLAPAGFRRGAETGLSSHE